MAEYPEGANRHRVYGEVLGPLPEEIADEKLDKAGITEERNWVRGALVGALAGVGLVGIGLGTILGPNGCKEKPKVVSADEKCGNELRRHLQSSPWKLNPETEKLGEPGKDKCNSLRRLVKMFRKHCRGARLKHVRQNFDSTKKDWRYWGKNGGEVKYAPGELRRAYYCENNEGTFEGMEERIEEWEK